MEAIQISSSRLKVDVAAPGTFYSGSRFDWTGFVTQVTLDGVHTFCVDESLIPGMGSGGRGLCNEFGIHAPVGYDEARVGEGFPKLGTGILTRTSDEPYDFFKPYPVEPYPVETVLKPAEAVFMVKPVDCNGYSYELIKTLRVDGNRLSVGYILKNTGMKEIHTTEYIHNFVSIDQKGIGPDYRLSFSFPPVGAGKPDIFEVTGQHISWKHLPREEFYWNPKGYEGLEEVYWTLKDTVTGAGLTEQACFQPKNLAIWGKGHVVSPEVFIDIHLISGEEQRWERIYTFFDK